MRSFLWVAFGVMLLQNSSPAQTLEANTAAGVETAAADASTPADKTTDPGSTAPAATVPEFVPMTASERARLYLKNAFGPGAILRAAAAGGISQWTNTPKEWGGGAAAYGDRLGSALAEHVIREAVEFGASTALHEDNRYVRSTDTGFFKRTKHAVGSIFVARNEAGQEHFAYSRFGSVMGASFISRLWEPRSEDSSGSAVVAFGLTMVSDMGWNVVKEFRPRHIRKP